MGRRVELVLLHRPGMEPTGTAAWISPRPLLARHHHVRLSNPKVTPPPIEFLNQLHADTQVHQNMKDCEACRLAIMNFSHQENIEQECLAARSQSM